MTPTERGEIYEFLEETIEEHGFEGLEVIVDALVTIAAGEAADGDDEEWIDVADELLSFHGKLPA